MITQFFGNYLLNEGYVEPKNLYNALCRMKDTKVKLGVLAMNAGYLNAAQVNEIHEKQHTVDKRFGEIAVDLGYLTGDQVEELFSMQKGSQLALGQALIDLGYMTNDTLEKALNDYKSENSLTDNDFKDADNEKIYTFIRSFYDYEGNKDETMVQYIDLLFKNIVRFVGDDFILLNSSSVKSYDFKNCAMQRIKGKFSCSIAIDAEDEAYLEFGRRFSGEAVESVDEFADACVGEFLNVHDGLFAVNVSNESGIELTLDPQLTIHNESRDGFEDAFVIPVVFPFGQVTFIVGSF